MTILDRLADHARRRTEQAKRKTPLAALERQALSMPKGGFAFEAALKKPGLSFICECKRASPSKGLIAPAYPYLQIAGEYEAAGADAVSVLTEPKWFLGSDEHLKEIADAVSVPCLRKDFTVDAYMIYEARLLGASAVLLICAILTDAELRAYLAICDALGLSALVEAHEEREVRMALDAGARVIGVNNTASGTLRWTWRTAAGCASRFRRRSCLSRRAASGTPEIYGASAPSAPTPYWSGKR